MPRGRVLLLVLTIFLVAAAATSRHAYARQQRVLVVMSYEETNVWEQNIRKGIESSLAGQCELRFFYMNTKQHLAGGAQKARQALALFKQFKPHGVIAADDNAQSLFVVPYLRNQVSTPVIFCGVNAAPDRYGYPARNVTGVLEHQRFRETIAFAQMLKPDIRTVGFLMRPTPTVDALRDEIEAERESYPAHILPITPVKTFEEAERKIDELRKTCDALMLTNLNALLDDTGKPLTEIAVIGPLAKRFGKVTMGTSPYHVEAGALLTVANSGIEQGTLAASMLLKCMRGTPVAALPITRNREGQRILNLSVMRALGIQPVPAALVGVTFYEGD